MVSINGHCVNIIAIPSLGQKTLPGTGSSGQKILPVTRSASPSEYDLCVLSSLKHHGTFVIIFTHSMKRLCLMVL